MLLVMTMMKICSVIINHFSITAHTIQLLLSGFGDNDYTDDDEDDDDFEDDNNHDNDVDAHCPPPWQGKASAVQAPCSCASE